MDAASSPISPRIRGRRSVTPSTRRQRGAFSVGFHGGSGFSRAGVEDSYGCFHLGGVAYYYDRYKDGRIRVIYGGITPADDTHTWFFEETVRCFALGPIGEWATVRWMQKLLDEDSSLLRDTVLANGAGGLERPVSVTSDRAGPCISPATRRRPGGRIRGRGRGRRIARIPALELSTDIEAGAPARPLMTRSGLT